MILQEFSLSVGYDSGVLFEKSDGYFSWTANFQGVPQEFNLTTGNLTCKLYVKLMKNNSYYIGNYYLSFG